jgi:hypothetical protein
MGFLKSLLLAAKSDTRAYNEAIKIHNEIQMILGMQSSVSPIELDQVVILITNDKIISQRVLEAVGFSDVNCESRAIDYNNIFDAILEELNKRQQLNQ